MPTWIRVRDVETGHTFDLNTNAAKALVASGAAEEVPLTPEHEGSAAWPRPAKHFVGLDGNPRPKRTTTSPAAQPAEIREES